MSFDLYLLPAAVVGADEDLAEAYVERANTRPEEFTEPPDPACERRKRELADLLLRLKPGYEEFPLDFEAIAEFEQIGVEEARRKYRSIEINGASEPPEAQFTFHDHYVAVSWYSGMPAEEMDAILAALSLVGDFVVYDPQGGEVYDLREETIA